MIAHDQKASWLSRCLRSVMIAGLAALVLAPTPRVTAQERGQEQEIAAARERVQMLLREAEVLEDAGRRDAAEGRRREAERLVARLERAHMERARDQGRDGEHVMQLLERLELGMSALAELGRHELVEEVRRVAAELREGIRERGEREGPERERDRGRNRERETAERQLEILRLAFTALREAERGDAAELVHRAIRAREVGLEGRRDEEARAIRERQPNRDQLRELVALAAELWAEFGWETRAAELGRAVDELWPRRGRQRERQEMRGEQRESMIHVLEAMELAKVALLEGGRQGSAELMDRAMQAQRVRIRGLQGEEAHMVLEREPELGARVELLNFAAEMWREFGDPEKSEMIAEVARRMWSEREVREHAGGREHAERREGDRGDRDRAERIDELREHLGELQRGIEELREELDRLRRDG